MISDRVRPFARWLFPPLNEGEGFHQETFTAAHRGLTILTFVQLTVGLLGMTGLLATWPSVVILAAGVLSAAAVRSNSMYPYNQTIGVLSSALAGLAAGWGLSTMGDRDFALGAPVLLLLAATAMLPLLPVQSFAIGCAAFVGAWQSDHRLFLLLVAFAAAIISATLYAERRAHYESYLSVLRTTEEFRALQSRLLIAENSNTMVRLSAALAHELSQPVGTVASGIDTLLNISTRAFSAKESDKQRLIGLQQDLARSLRDSLDRLRKMVNRIQRLTSLDEADTEVANINVLLEEAVALVGIQEKTAPPFDLDLHLVPDIRCRPQQLIAVFSILLTNSIQATDGAGKITISSGTEEQRIRICIADNGRGIPADRLQNIFTPGFQVSGGRVATGNWNMFTSRQFIRDHGGDMRIQSREGEGTTVILFLPC